MTQDADREAPDTAETRDPRYILVVGDTEWLQTPGSDEDVRLKDLDPAYAATLRRTLEIVNGDDALTVPVVWNRETGEVDLLTTPPEFDRKVQHNDGCEDLHTFEPPCSKSHFAPEHNDGTDRES